MRNTITTLLAVFLGVVTVAVAANAEQHPELKVFPDAEPGMQRFVIVLPEKTQEDEDSFRIELIVGKEILADGVNRVGLASTIETQTLEGWAYPYYVVAGSGEITSTLMAPPPGASMVKSFVSAPSLDLRYNSRLPIVVYVPAGYEVRYRIWQGSADTFKAAPA
jgi:ecotin